LVTFGVRFPFHINPLKGGDIRYESITVLLNFQECAEGAMRIEADMVYTLYNVCLLP
jgi:hypothetical protein